jgi:hypothetical protein
MSETKLAPDLAVAEAFWAAFSPGDSTIRLRFLGAHRPPIEKEYASPAEASPDVTAYQSEGYNAYFFPNKVSSQPFERVYNEAKGGVDFKNVFTKDIHVDQIRAYFCDFDEGIPENWEWVIEPDLIVHTSVVNGVQKGQAYWLVNAVARGTQDPPAYARDFKRDNQRLQRHYKADSAAVNISRVLRLSGSLHLKDPGNPQLVTFEVLHDAGPPIANKWHLAHFRFPSVVLAGIPELPAAPEKGEKQSTPVAQERLEELLSWVDPDCEYNDWITTIFAIAATMLDTTVPAALATQFPRMVADEQTRLRDIAHRWSRGELDRNGKYAKGPPAAYDGNPSDDKIDALFDDADPEREDGVGFGSIVHAAKIAGYEPPSSKSSAEEEPKEGDGLTGDEERFRGFRLADPVQQIEWWDQDKLFPKYDTGGSLLIYAKQGMHKTNIALRFGMDIIEAGGIVVYMAGEGANGVRASRLPAHLLKRGWTAEELKDRWITIPATPIFRDPKNVQAAIRALRKQGIDPAGPRRIVIFIDTLATAGMGLEENTSELSEQLTGNGAVGTLARVFKALVVILAHEGKTEGKDARGHSGIMGNVDAALQLKTRKDVGAIEVKVTKMRDGEDDRSVYFRVKKGEVPVPERIAFPEFKDLDKEQDRLNREKTRQEKDDAEKTATQLLREVIAGQIEASGCTTFEKGLPDSEMAKVILAVRGMREPPKDHFEPHAEWQTAIKDLAKDLQDMHAPKTVHNVKAIGSRRWGRDAANRNQMHWRWHDNENYPKPLTDIRPDETETE